MYFYNTAISGSCAINIIEMSYVTMESTGSTCFPQFTFLIWVNICIDMSGSSDIDNIGISYSGCINISIMEYIKSGWVESSSDIILKLWNISRVVVSIVVVIIFWI